MGIKRCRHNWGLARGKYYGPIEEACRVWNIDWLPILYGETLVHQDCTKCGTTRSYQVAGRVEFPKIKAPLSDLSKLIVRVTDGAEAEPEREDGWSLYRLFHNCEHSWGAAAGIFFHPYDREISLKGMVSDTMVRCITRGITTLTHRCKKCHMVESWIRTGMVDIPGVTNEIVVSRA